MSARRSPTPASPLRTRGQQVNLWLTVLTCGAWGICVWLPFVLLRHLIRWATRPQLRVSTDKGSVDGEPSREQLEVLLRRVRSGGLQFLRAERRGTGQFIQTARNPGGSWVVERNDGDRTQHYQVAVETLPQVEKIMAAWMFPGEVEVGAVAWNHMPLR